MTASIIGPGADREGYDHHSGNITLGGNGRPNPHRFRKSFLGHFILALGIFTVLVVFQSHHGSHQPQKGEGIDSTGEVKGAPVIHEVVNSNLAHGDILDSFTGSAAEYVNHRPGASEQPPEEELRISVSPHLSSPSSSSQDLESIKQERDQLQKELGQSRILIERLQRQLLDLQSAQLEQQQLLLSTNQAQTPQQQRQDEDDEEIQTTSHLLHFEQADLRATTLLSTHRR